LPIGDPCANLRLWFEVIGRVQNHVSLLQARRSRWGSSSPARNGDTLALPVKLAGFSTHDGEAYFAESDAREAYFPLASNFLTQKTQAYCGVASIVMVLNALGIPAPAVPEYAPYKGGETTRDVRNVRALLAEIE
jgi:Phytochelatin synthase